ncbi:MAG: response regulator [Phycisphaerales bacterium]|nr:MAG: response regulator [Phycisphaerales bacterium]
MPSNVLIVDDSATIRQMVKRTLHIAGLDVGAVFEASNGVEALAQLNDHEVACLVVDINMPTMNGIQLLTRIKKNARLKDIPIVITSTEGSRKRITQMEDLGAFEYLRKPFRPEQLRDVLKPLLGVVDDAGTEDSLTCSSRF